MNHCEKCGRAPIHLLYWCTRCGYFFCGDCFGDTKHEVCVNCNVLDEEDGEKIGVKIQ